MSEWLTAPDPALQAVLQVGARVSWRGQDGKAATGTVAATSPLRLRVESVAGCSAGVRGVELAFSAAQGWPAGLRVVGIAKVRTLTCIGCEETVELGGPTIPKGWQRACDPARWPQPVFSVRCMACRGVAR